MSQNLFDRLVRTAQDIARKAIENVDGTVYSYGDLFDLAGRLALRRRDCVRDALFVCF